MVIILLKFGIFRELFLLKISFFYLRFFFFDYRISIVSIELDESVE